MINWYFIQLVSVLYVGRNWTYCTLYPNYKTKCRLIVVYFKRKIIQCRTVTKWNENSTLVCWISYNRSSVQTTGVENSCEKNRQRSRAETINSWDRLPGVGHTCSVLATSWRLLAGRELSDPAVSTGFDLASVTYVMLFSRALLR